MTTSTDGVCCLSFTVVLVTAVQHVDSKVICCYIWLVAHLASLGFHAGSNRIRSHVFRPAACRDNALIQRRPTDNHLGRLCEWRSMHRLTGDGAAAAGGGGLHVFEVMILSVIAIVNPVYHWCRQMWLYYCFLSAIKFIHNIIYTLWRSSFFFVFFFVFFVYLVWLSAWIGLFCPSGILPFGEINIVVVQKAAALCVQTEVFSDGIDVNFHSLCFWCLFE